jgi:hypothetical protein
MLKRLLSKRVINLEMFNCRGISQTKEITTNTSVRTLIQEKINKNLGSGVTLN